MIINLIFINLFLHFYSIKAGSHIHTYPDSSMGSNQIHRSVNKRTTYFELLDTLLIDKVMNYMPLEEQWNTFTAYPKYIPHPSEFVYDSRKDYYGNLSLFESNGIEPELIGKRSKEIIRGFLFASNISFTCFDTRITDAIIINLKNKSPAERKANNIKFLRVEGSLNMFRQLLYLFQIDLNTLHHLELFLLRPDENDNLIPFPILQGTNQLKSLTISRLENSSNISKLIKNLLSNAKHLEKIRIDCGFLYFLPAKERVRVNSEWEEAIKHISTLSSISFEICPNQSSYDFLTVLLKNQASSLKELSLFWKRGYKLLRNIDTYLKFKNALNEFKTLEMIQLHGLNNYDTNEVSMMLLRNNIHLKHLVINTGVNYPSLQFLSSDDIINWRETMKELKELESLLVSSVSKAFSHLPIEFFMNIIEGLKQTSSLKELTLQWAYDKNQNTKALLKLIKEVKSLETIHLPDVLENELMRENEK